MTAPSRLVLWGAYGLVAVIVLGLFATGNVIPALLVIVVALILSAALWPRRVTEAPPDVADYPDMLAELTRSRREIVSAFEIERRRIERDLHDGAQQYIVAASMKLGEASLDVAPDSPAGQLLGAAQDDIDRALRALRQTVHGIHPKVLTDLGLEASVRDLAARVPGVQVRCPHPLPALPQGVVAAGYFFVSEALTNAAKYAPGSAVTVLLACDDTLRISVTDDGPGGAVIRPGHGLSGMRERLAAFGGTLELSSPAGGPTQLIAAMPLLLNRGESAVATPTTPEEDA
ncbi:sensor histidine kinase [Bowdeniella massiliensis]|uniref:sensor histidine kinase n=1 Tax=Bowdeniella massiliensis TaxID=2932264 RepID=UPI002027DC6B|nr:histidine kinase [Bowdeniella massiliensis]